MLHTTLPEVLARRLTGNLEEERCFVTLKTKETTLCVKIYRFCIILSALHNPDVLKCYQTLSRKSHWRFRTRQNTDLHEVLGLHMDIYTQLLYLTDIILR